MNKNRGEKVDVIVGQYLHNKNLVRFCIQTELMTWRLNNQQMSCPLPNAIVQGDFPCHLVGCITESSHGCRKHFKSWGHMHAGAPWHAKKGPCNLKRGTLRTNLLKCGGMYSLCPQFPGLIESILCLKMQIWEKCACRKIECYGWSYINLDEKCLQKFDV